MLRLLPLLLLPTAARAADDPAAVITASSYWQAMLALLLIVGLLFAAAWLARKVSGGKVFGQGRMQVIGGVALGPRERIVLVEVEDTWLVIGIVPGQIRTLHQLPKGSPPSGDTPSAPPFAQWLKSIKDRPDHAA